jgi:hypothetical protein
MDKVKEQLAVVARHSFWIMCSVILVVCLVSWYLSTSALYKKQQDQLAAIKTNFTNMDSLKGIAKHPNPQTAEGMAQLLRAYSLQVRDGWQQQYDQQADVLKWPASFDEIFRERVNKLRPIEIVPNPTPITMDLEIRERQLYRDFIADELPVLAETIGAPWRASAAAVTSTSGYGGGADGGYGPSTGLGGDLGGGYGADSSLGGGYPGGGYPGGGMPGGMPGSGMPGAPGSVGDDALAKAIVIWSPTNQQELLGTHFGFIASEVPPSTLQVLYAQEDLWVLQNIMDMIKAANRIDDRDATARHEATVKMIDFVRIGRSAMGLAGRVSPVGAQAMAGMGSYGMEMGSDSTGSVGMGSADMAGSSDSSGAPGAAAAVGSSGGMPGMSGMDSTGGMQVVNTDPAFGRYVNEKYEPLDPKRLRDAWHSKNPDDALLAVAKRMPVRMRFTIDQRRLNKLLAECGNSRLPVEVRQVRINREPAPAGGMGGGGYGGGYAGGYGNDGGMSGMPGDAGGMGGGLGMGGMGMGGMGMSGMGMSGMGGSTDSDYGTNSYDSGGAMPGMASGMPGMGGMGRPGAPRAVGGANSTAAIDPNLVIVELYGIVSIYNPVNKSQLGLEEATTTVSAPTAEPTTLPAPTTPAPATTPTTTPATPVSSPAPAEAASTTVPPPAAIVPAVGTGS